MTWSPRDHMDLLEMAAEVRTQDNMATADPVYQVREPSRNGAYDDRTAFFTLRAARAFICNNAHNLHHKAHVWTASAHRNGEWKLIRRLLDAIVRGEAAIVSGDGVPLDAHVIKLAAEEKRETENRLWNLTRRVELYERALMKIDGGDRPIDDARELQRIAFQALRGSEQ